MFVEVVYDSIFALSDGPSRGCVVKIEQIINFFVKSSLPISEVSPGTFFFKVCGWVEIILLSRPTVLKLPNGEIPTAITQSFF